MVAVVVRLMVTSVVGARPMRRTTWANVGSRRRMVTAAVMIVVRGTVNLVAVDANLLCPPVRSCVAALLAASPRRGGTPVLVTQTSVLLGTWGTVAVGRTTRARLLREGPDRPRATRPVAMRAGVLVVHAARLAETLGADANPSVADRRRPYSPSTRDYGRRV